MPLGNSERGLRVTHLSGAGVARLLPQEVSSSPGFVPQEVEVLQGLSGVGGLELARVEHEETDEVEATHHRGIARLLTH